MVPFFVQIKCQLGKSYEVANKLADAEIASEIYSTAGDFDLLVKFYVDPRPTSAISSPRRCRPFRASPTPAPSSPSRRSGRRNVRPGAAAAPPAGAALERELVLAPDHEQARAGDDRGAEHDHHRRRFAEHRVAENQRPDHRGVVERRHHRRRGVAIALGEKNVAGAAEKADRRKRGKFAGRSA